MHYQGSTPNPPLPPPYAHTVGHLLEEFKPHFPSHNQLSPSLYAFTVSGTHLGATYNQPRLLHIPPLYSKQGSLCKFW